MNNLCVGFNIVNWEKDEGVITIGGGEIEVDGVAYRFNMSEDGIFLIDHIKKRTITFNIYETMGHFVKGEEV